MVSYAKIYEVACPCVPRPPCDAHLLGFRLPSLSLGLQNQQFHLGASSKHEELWDSAGNVFKKQTCNIVLIGVIFQELMVSLHLEQDVQWNDLDYMERYLDFTLGSDFATLPDMVKDMHAHDQRYVMIVVRPPSCPPVVAPSLCVCMTSVAMFGLAGPRN